MNLHVICFGRSHFHGFECAERGRGKIMKGVNCKVSSRDTSNVVSFTALSAIFATRFTAHGISSFSCISALPSSLLFSGMPLHFPPYKCPFRAVVLVNSVPQ